MKNKIELEIIAAFFFSSWHSEFRRRNRGLWLGPRWFILRSCLSNVSVFAFCNDQSWFIRTQARRRIIFMIIDCLLFSGRSGIRTRSYNASWSNLTRLIFIIENNLVERFFHSNQVVQKALDFSSFYRVLIR